MADKNEYMKLNIDQKETRRIKTALKKILAKLEPDRLKAADSMLDNAAFLIVTLARLRDAMNERGVVEIYQHGENQSGRKISAEAQLYNQLIKNYLATMKQVLDLLPKADAAAVKDGFEEFVYKR